MYKEGKLAADAMEALIGAIYVDQGLQAAAEFVDTRMMPHLTRLYEESHAARASEDAVTHVDDRDRYFRDRLEYAGEPTDEGGPPAPRSA